MSPGASLRAVRRYSRRRLFWFALDRGLRVVEAGLPLRLHTLLARVPRHLDRAALRAWGEREAECAHRTEGDPRSGRVDILGWSRVMDPDAPDWEARGMPALYAERLHYLRAHAEAGQEDPAYLARVLEDHWKRCRPGRGPGWTPFAVARRTLVLAGAVARLTAGSGVPDVLFDPVRRHLAAAAGFLELRLERHSRGNHLLTERIAGAVLARLHGETPDWWSLVDVVEAQFCSGGGHCERSVRYHLDVLDDLGVLHRVWGDAIPESVTTRLEPVLARARAFAAALQHADGDVPLFNDASLDDGLRAADLSAPSPPDFKSFPEEGFARWARGGRVVLFDCGPLGPSDQPSHAHCDALSFELSDGNHRVVGNLGTAAYEGPQRRMSRGTAAHSTLQLGDREQGELVGDFRLGGQGRAEWLQVDARGASGRFHWPGGGVHERRIEPLPDGVRVVDGVTGTRPDETAVARFHLPDAMDVSVDGAVRWRNRRTRWVLTVRGGRLRARAGQWWPRPGSARPAWTVSVDARAGIETIIRRES